MLMPMRTFLETKALFAQGWTVREVLGYFAEKDVKIGINTLYRIRNGNFLPTARGKNKWFLEGEQGRVVRLEKRIEEEIEAVRKDVVSRTTRLEEEADVELLTRLGGEEKKELRASDLVSIADSAAKRRALAQNRPTDIFRIFDNEFSNADIIDLIPEDENNSTNTKGLPAEPGGAPEALQIGEPLPGD